MPRAGDVPKKALLQTKKRSCGFRNKSDFRVLFLMHADVKSDLVVLKYGCSLFNAGCGFLMRDCPGPAHVHGGRLAFSAANGPRRNFSKQANKQGLGVPPCSPSWAMPSWNVLPTQHFSIFRFTVVQMKVPRHGVHKIEIRDRNTVHASATCYLAMGLFLLKY